MKLLWPYGEFFHSQFWSSPAAMNPSTSTACGEDQPSDEDHLDDWLYLSSSSVQCPEAGRDQPEAQDGSKLRSKFMSAWNSVKYGWTFKQKSHFSKSSPVVVLGNVYHLKDSSERDCFYRCFESLLWLTYRRGFSPLVGSSLTSDSGWGCLLRTGQMMLAQALLLHLMPPGWSWSPCHHVVKDDMDLPETRSQPISTDDTHSFRTRGSGKKSRTLSLGSLLDSRMESTHRRAVSWFADRPEAPFGIHQLVELGKSSGKRAGDWYGPSIVAHILEKAVSVTSDLPNLVVYVAQDCTIYKGDVRRACERPAFSSSVQHWKSVVLLVPVRLGGQELNPAYIACVKKLLRLQCCIGIIGGKPRHSLFFVGFQGDHLLYLDPHYCQPTVDTTKDGFPLESFHCKHPRKMPISRMDPSCTIGFYATGQRDFESLCRAVSEAVSTSAETYPMFIFADGHNQEDEEGETRTNVTYIQRKPGRRRVDTCNSLDEFVLL
ncbi:cysteine protease atg4da-like [Synchiropus splendidus]|uniref:cysteine protease atg4da-like n=1 Tax=Synchiropus splendidus TaxID=270530 RepID=UPI00237EB87C|nr:cysteine protease atg4da-like [Synchiropus splendidus]